MFSDLSISDHVFNAMISPTSFLKVCRAKLVLKYDSQPFGEHIDSGQY